MIGWHVMTTEFSQVSVAVVGSVNLDMVASVQRFPVPGETISNAVVNRFPGGKGANQAMAAKRLGAEVYMVACVGKDAAAEDALGNMRSEGVNLDYCRKIEGFSTGLAMIIVAADGENQIVVAPGANAAFRPELLTMPVTDAVIVQLELPMATVLKAAENTAGFFCLNAAPAREVPRAVLDLTDLLVVNEIEAQAIGGRLQAYTGYLATTLGGEGAILTRNGREITRVKPPAVEVVDTTGAGDAFTAALTVGMVCGLAPDKALKLACAAGALATTKPGAQSSPHASELLES